MNEFKLFVAGETARTRKISMDLELALIKIFGGEYSLRVIDMIKNPHLAQEDSVLATPTLIKTTPPVKRVFGDFNNMENILKRLDIYRSTDTPDL